MDGRWQHETPYEEELKLVRHSNDLRFEGVLLCGAVRRLVKLLGSIPGKWQAQRVGKREGERFSEVEQEDEGRLSTAQDIWRKSTDVLRRIIVPVEEQGGVTSSCVCPHCH